MAIKLDISKTSDKFEWSFLEAMLRKLGFDEVWISRIMTCVTTVSYSVLVNANIVLLLNPLEAFVKEILYPLIYTSFVLRGLVHFLMKLIIPLGLEVSKWLEVVLLLIILFFFTDDNIIFCRAKLKEWREIQKFLDTYASVIGQGINKSKTGVFFNSNTRNVVKDQILNSTSLSLCNKQEKYLSLPMMVGRNRYHTIKAIKDKV